MTDQKMTAAELRARIEKAHAEVYALCGGKSWKMEIPWNYDTDSDLVITDGLKAGEDALDEIARLRAEVTRLQAERDAPNAKCFFCEQPFTNWFEVYRCADCDGLFHKSCLVNRHFTEND